ncbi:condensation domain-containing protein [Streptomyces sp. NPDC054766]
MADRTDELLVRLAGSDVRLSPDGQRLRYDGPAAAVTPQLLAALRELKSELMVRLGTGRVVRSGPVTREQRRYLAVHEKVPLPQVLNVPFRVGFEGALDVRALRGALAGLVLRHESLRTRYRRDGAHWQQEVMSSRPLLLPVEDLTEEDDPEGAARRIAEKEAAVTFDPCVGTAPRLRLLRTGPRAWTLVLVLHHSACDGWSVSLLLSELAALYTAIVTGRPLDLDSRVPQTLEYALWQQDRAADPAYGARSRAYWAGTLRGLRAGHALPLDRPRPKRLSGRGATEFFTVPAGTRQAVEACAARHGTTGFAVCAAAFGMLMCKLSGRPELPVVAPYANRERRELEALAACTATPFVLRLTAGDDADLGVLAARTGLGALESIERLLPVSDVEPYLAPDTSTGAALPISFHFQNSLDLGPGLALPDVTAAVTPVAGAASRDELGLGLIPVGDVLSGYAEFSTDLWDAATVRGWIRDYVALLHRAAGLGAAS